MDVIADKEIFWKKFLERTKKLANIKPELSSLSEEQKQWTKTKSWRVNSK